MLRAFVRGAAATFVALFVAFAIPALAQQGQRISITTGGTGGVYYPLGGGMANFQTVCLFPVYCSVCRSLQCSNLLNTPVRCKDCGGLSVVAYDSPELLGEAGTGFRSAGPAGVGGLVAGLGLGVTFGRDASGIDLHLAVDQQGHVEPHQQQGGSEQEEPSHRMPSEKRHDVSRQATHYPLELLLG